MIFQHLQDKHQAATALSRATWGAIAVGSLSVVAAPWIAHPAARLLFGGSAAVMGGTAIALDRQKRKLEVVLKTAEAEGAIATIAALRRELAPARIEQALALPESTEPLPQSQWWGDVLGYPTVLVYGQFGSGKTTLAERLVNDRRAAGHQVKVLDPHLAAGAWPGCETVGSGMDYRAIDSALGDFAEEVETRYKLLSKNSRAEFQPITYVCDEFTHWSDRTKRAADFFAATMADTRKVKMFAVFVGHGRTLQCVGGKGGLAKTRDDSLLEVKLFAKPDPSSPTGVSPTGFGELKYPGNPELVRVAIDRWQPAALPPAQTQVVNAIEKPADVQWLKQCWDSAIEVGHETIQETALEPTPTQQELVNALVQLSRKNGAVSAQDCQRYSRKFKTLSAEEIRTVFLVAQAVGLGMVDGDGQSARFTALRRD